MINIYDFICSNSSHFAQLKFGNDEKIFIDYLCPITEEKARVWSHKNCLMYIDKGAKGYSSIDYYHKSDEQQVLFIRKGGYILNQYFEKPYRALIFMFDDLAVKELLLEYPDLLKQKVGSEKYFISKPTVLQLESSSFIQSIFITSLEYLKHPSVESKISLEIKFKELIVNLLREKDSNEFYSYLSWLHNDEKVSFIKLMYENRHFSFSSEELAKIACMSLSTFKRIFKKHFGISPGKWLRIQRIEKAKDLLKNTNKSISEIAFDLGYGDTASFSKAFKLTTKINPTDFR